MNHTKICSVSTAFTLVGFLLLLSAFSSSANAAQLSLSSATQSSTGFSGVAERAIDDNISGIFSQGSVTHTDLANQPWWSAELSSQTNIEEVVLWNRTNCCSDRLSDFYLLISEAPFATSSLLELLNDSNVWSSFHAGAVGESVSIPVEAAGQYVRVQLAGQNYLSLAEVQVYGELATAPGSSLAGPQVASSESFTLTQPDGDSWTEVGFTESFSSPPVVIPSVLTSNDADPAEVMLSDLTVDGVDVQSGEWEYQDGVHGDELVGLLLLETGAHNLGGLNAVAGSASVSGSLARVEFGVDFTSAPVVLAQLLSEKGDVTATVRLRDVDTTGFSAWLQTEEALGTTGDVRELHYVAIEEGSGEYDGQRLLVGKTDRVVNHVVREVAFGEDLESPLFYAQDQQTFGGDTSWVRLVSLSADGAGIIIQEEQSANTETAHTTEVVGWMAIGLGANAPSPNILPIADAGDEQTVISGADVTLDGGGSVDSDGSIVSYVWTDVGSEVGTGVNPVLSGLAVGEHTIELLVTDDDGGTATDVVVLSLIHI